MKPIFAAVLAVISCHASLAQTAFTCDGLAYQAVGNPAHLYRFNFDNNQYTDLGAIGTSLELRAVGYRKNDNYAYGIQNQTSNLVKFGISGTPVITPLTGTYAADLVGVNTVAGDFATDGFLYVMTGGATNIVYKIDVTNATVNERFFTSEAFDKGDIVWSSVNSVFYTVGSTASSAGPEYLYTFPLGTNGSTVTVSKIATSVPGGTAFTYIGALFVDSQDRIFGYFNNTGRLYLFSKTTGASTEIVNPGIVTAQNDGFACAPMNHTLLPLTLLSFSAQPAAPGYRLEWETSFEQNTSHFEIEYAANGNSFTYLNKVMAAGNSSSTINYHYQTSPLSSDGRIMFRLKMVDLDGSFTYSKIAIVGAGQAEKNFRIYPTIAQAGQPVYLFMNMSEEVTIYYAGNGQLIKRIAGNNNNQAYTLSTVGWLPGTYILKTKDNAVKLVVR